VRQRPLASRLAAVAAALLAALALAACGTNAEDTGGESEPQVKVITTLAVFEDIVRQIGGERVEVSALLPFGADPHTYEPTPSQIRTIAEADVIFVNDLQPGVEGSVLDVIQNNKGGDAWVVPFLDRIHTAGTGISDNPHLWLSPTFARAYAGIIEGTLAKADPAGAGEYGTNLSRYDDRLSQLDAEISAAVEEIPPQNRKLVTPHDAFRHLAQRYNLDMVGFVVPGPGQDPSPGDIADLSQAIRDQGVPAVFVEPQVGPESRLLRQIAADAGVEVCTLYSDSLDEDVPTYIDLMRFNADELARCLGV